MKEIELNEIELEELERILTTEEDLQPMTGFSTRVMRAVREEATATEPIAFPWARFLPGFLLNVGLLVGAVVWLALEPASSSSAQLISAEWLSDPQMQGLLWATLALVGSGVLAWTASRWAAPRRTASY
ncbi:MAG: hypothetical protein MPN21_20325 [Thermoanaerobaculia bacterium]|nr:hypothetical protein [Thermoanaerobaculia bacterium]